MKLVISTVLFIAALILAAYTFSVLLLIFAGILFAILLRSATDWLHARVGLSHGASTAIIVVGLALMFGLNIWLFGMNFAGQIDQLKATLGRAREQIQIYTAQYEWSRNLLNGARPESVVSRAPGAVSGLARFIGSLILMGMIAIYTAANPALYRQAFLRLFRPGTTRRRVDETLLAIASALRWWLAGQMVSMFVVGVLTTTGLWLLGVPLPFTLGLLTAVLNFIPNIGAILSAVLAAALALTVSVHLAGYSLLLYVVIQSFEAYLLTPLIQQRAVQLPPGLTIAVQALMGVVAGGLGLALAAPITVVGLVLTRKFHLNQDLGRRRSA